MTNSKLVELIDRLKSQLIGTWKGRGFSKYPTITDTAYSETWVFTADEFKPCIHYNQKTWYENETDQNGHTVFWDTGFILLKDADILLISSQAGGRQETYKLTSWDNNIYTFESIAFGNDPRMIRSQRTLTISDNSLSYELNMETLQNRSFENHLKAELKRA
ncbi:MAG: FABP family protein [Cyclobacteriaceae bacterium]